MTPDRAQWLRDALAGALGAGVGVLALLAGMTLGELVAWAIRP